MTGQEVLNAVRFTYLSNGRWHRLTAEEERSLWGVVVFGRRKVMFEPKTNSFHTYVVVAYGADYDTQTYSLDQVAALISAVQVGKRLGYGDKIYIRN